MRVAAAIGLAALLAPAGCGRPPPAPTAVRAGPGPSVAAAIVRPPAAAPDGTRAVAPGSITRPVPPTWWPAPDSGPGDLPDDPARLARFRPAVMQAGGLWGPGPDEAVVRATWQGQGVSPDGDRVEVLHGRDRDGWHRTKGRATGERVEVLRGRPDPPRSDGEDGGFAGSAPVLFDDAYAPPVFGDAPPVFDQFAGPARRPGLAVGGWRGGRGPGRAGDPPHRGTGPWAGPAAGVPPIFPAPAGVPPRAPTRVGGVITRHHAAGHPVSPR